MLHLERNTSQWSDGMFRDFPERLRPGDLMVFNNTRVFPARLYGRREGRRAQAVSPNSHSPATRDFLHGRIEVLLARQISTEPNDWECLVRPGRKIGVGEHLFFGEPDGDELQAEVLSRAEFGERRIRFLPPKSKNDSNDKNDNNDRNDDFFATLDRIGHVPLPPNIARPDSS